MCNVFQSSPSNSGRSSNDFRPNLCTGRWGIFRGPRNIPAAGALAVFAGMREPNISETHVARLGDRHEKKSKMAQGECGDCRLSRFLFGKCR